MDQCMTCETVSQYSRFCCEFVEFVGFWSPQVLRPLLEISSEKLLQKNRLHATMAGVLTRTDGPKSDEAPLQRAFSRAVRAEKVP